MTKPIFKFILLPVLAIALITVIVNITGFSVTGRESEVNQCYHDKLLRFHVIANSDLPEDQELKIEVMEEVLKDLKPDLEKLDDIEETKELLKSKLDHIEQIAERRIREKGMQYDVKARLDTFLFPIKTYGLITLPAGQYQALRVEIGEAKGSNWWCILFPPLCFVDITQGLTPEKTIKDLKKVLTEEEIQQLKTINEPSQIPIEIRFKIAEWFQGIGNKLVLTLDKFERRQ